MNIVLATRNRKKIEEIKKIFSTMKMPILLYTLDDFPGYQGVKEDGKTFKENAIKKASHVSKYTGMVAIADDSGLEVDALDGAPGILSARYAGESADDRANIDRLLKEMKNIPSDKRGARFTCCIAIAFPDGEIKTFNGYIKGRIGMEPRGENGFGYDPIFYPEDYNKTFAEMSDTEKNAISHRARALRALQEYLLEEKRRVFNGD
jgi:XTP/dITP diphosphohydrolase